MSNNLEPPKLYQIESANYEFRQKQLPVRRNIGISSKSPKPTSKGLKFEFHFTPVKRGRKMDQRIQNLFKYKNKGSLNSK